MPVAEVVERGVVKETALADLRRFVMCSRVSSAPSSRAETVRLRPHLFPTYGDFLGGDTAFRSHPKLPNVIERFVARDQWPIVGWFAQLATREPDAVDETGRRDEMEHLRQSVGERLGARGDEAPDELKRLGHLLGSPSESPEQARRGWPSGRVGGSR